ncbi:lytic transglycosylase domain-containing protein [Variovorax sp. VNK109]|jgi:type IV secretion system protein VirB1|uniref:lytic transglycosylase domain-containing protein n=1 Tax=Variovorax sp. VNK109 TaxID=3400919 RepID=UPI003C0C3BE1
MLEFLELARECAPAVHPQTLAAIVQTESGFNPWAIGVVNGRLERQPKNQSEAVATAKALVEAGYNASFGLGQINLSNLEKYALDLTTVFEPCRNLSAASAILSEAYGRASRVYRDEQSALQAALSAYYSGNFSTGFRHGYVQKVAANAVTLQREDTQPIRVVPAIERRADKQPSATAEPEAGQAAPRPEEQKSTAVPQSAPRRIPDRTGSGSSVIFTAP